MRTYIITRTCFSNRGRVCGRVDLAYTEEEARELYAKLSRTLSPRGFTAIRLESASAQRILERKQLPQHKRTKFVRTK